MSSLIPGLLSRARSLTRTGIDRLPVRVQYAIRRTGRTAIPLARRAFESRWAQPLVSVVIPVYNVEAFLPECLDSVVGQTYGRLQIICVDDGSPDDSIDILRAYAGRDPRIEIVRQANAGLGAARNVGAGRARGRFLMFLDSDDVLEPDAIATYMRALRRTGSDFAVSSYRRMNAGGTWAAAPWIRQAHRRTTYATTLADSPDILVNAVAWSKCYRRDFWNAHRLRFPENVLYEDQAVSARAFALADRFDLLAKVTVNWRVRHDRSSITQQRVAIDDLRARLRAAFDSLAELTAAGAVGGHDARLAQLLSNDFPLSIKSAQHADDEFWEVLTDGLRRLVDQAGPQVWAQVPAQHRLSTQLVTAGLRDEVIDFVGLGHDNPKNCPAVIEDGQVYAQFPARTALGLADTDPLLALPPSQLGLVTGITAVRWLDGSRLELRGWGYVDNVDAGAGAQVTAVLTPVGADGPRPTAGPVRTPARCTPDPAVTAVSKHRYANYENCCFTVVLDADDLFRRSTGERDSGPGGGPFGRIRWQIDIETVVAGITRQGPLRGLQLAGSGGRLPGRLLPDGARVSLAYTNRDGLSVQIEPTLAVLTGAELADRRLDVTVKGDHGFVPRQVELRALPAGRTPGRATGATTGPDPAGALTVRTVLRSRLEAVADVAADVAADHAAAPAADPAAGPAADPPADRPLRGELVIPDPVLDPSTAPTIGAAVIPTLWSVRVTGLDGRTTPLAVPDDTVIPAEVANPRLRITAHQNLGVIDEPRVVRLTAVEAPPVGPDGSASLRLFGVLLGGDPVVQILLRAPHAESSVLVQSGPGGRFEAELPLTSDPWQHGVRPLPVGKFRVTARVGEEPGIPTEIPVELTEEVISRLPIDIRTGGAVGQCHLDGPVGLGLTLTLPLADDEIGLRQQQRLQSRLASRRSSPDRQPGAVLFRSYFGETCSCNPLAVHTELRRRGTDHTLYWAVKDHSIAVPEGGVPVVHESAEWYRLLHEADYYMDNMHQPIYHRKPAHQTQIQTFHGYPFKQMGLSHWAQQNRDVAHVRSYLERAADWDYLVSPASYGTEALVREFGFPNEVLEIGYPRNDVLQGPDAGLVRDRVRDTLGIRPDQRVVLYGPTFRDHLAQNDVRAPMVDFLDTRTLATELGPDWVILVRGHAFNARVASRVGSHGTVLDVTDYPDINDLVLASDCAVLDYSSLRFDYSLTGKPMLFMVPDLTLWSQSSRGALFDYEPTAPGPKLMTTAEVAAALLDLDRVAEEYADAYALFRKTFCDLDDGHAAERLVDRVFTH